MQNPAHARWGSQAGTAAEQAANLIIALRRAQHRAAEHPRKHSPAPADHTLHPQHQPLGQLFVWERHRNIPGWVFVVVVLFCWVIHLWGGLSPSLKSRIYLGVPFERLTTCTLLGLFQGDKKMELFVLPVGILGLNVHIASTTQSRSRLLCITAQATTRTSDQWGTTRLLSVHSSPTEVNRTPSVLYIYPWVDAQMIRGLLCALAQEVLAKLSQG